MCGHDHLDPAQLLPASGAGHPASCRVRPHLDNNSNQSTDSQTNIIIDMTWQNRQ